MTSITVIMKYDKEYMKWVKNQTWNDQNEISTKIGWNGMETSWSRLAAHI